MKLKLVKRQPETHDTETFFWQSDTPVTFKPGQYLKWTVRDDHPDDRGNQRWFTISGSPTEPNLRLTTKFNEKSSSFKKTLQSLSIGDKIEGFGPIGSFVLPEDPAQPLVFVAGGIGITPFRAMIKYLADSNLQTPVHLLYACRSDQDIAFKAELEGWADQLHNLQIRYVLSSMDSPSSAENDRIVSEAGQLTGQKIVALTKDDPNPIYYLSGPEPMIDSLNQQLTQIIPVERVKHDFFPNYTEF